MYVKVYAQIFDSTIADDFRLRHFFMDLLILADKSGIVDMTETAISRRTGIPIEDVKCFLKRLMEPDAASRTPEMEGRRIILIDDHKPWGWRIVNFALYRGLQNEDQRKEQMRAASKAYRDRIKSKLASSDDESNRHQKSSKEEAVSSKQEAVTTEEAKLPASSCSTPQTTVACERLSAVFPSSVPNDPEHTACPPSEKTMKREAAASAVKGTPAETIFLSYPRRIAKAAAIKAINKVLKAGEVTFDQLLQSVQEFARSPAGKAGQYTPHPATWFNRGSYNDDRREWQRRSDRVSAATVHDAGFAEDVAQIPVERGPAANGTGKVHTGLFNGTVPC